MQQVNKDARIKVLSIMWENNRNGHSGWNNNTALSLQFKHSYKFTRSVLISLMASGEIKKHEAWYELK